MIELLNEHKMKKQINQYFIIPLLICAFSCGNKHTDQGGQETPAAANEVSLDSIQLVQSGLATGSLQSMNIAATVRVSGKIDVPPQNMVSVSMPLGGYLKSTKLLPGMHINKGEVIAVMEDQQYIQLQQDYLMAKAQKKLMEQEYERQKELNISKASSDKVFQQAEATYRNQQITLRAFEEKLRLIGINPAEVNENTLSRAIHLYAPINGYVSKVNVNIGKYVNPTDVLFELVNPEDIHLALTVFEKDMDKLFIGQKVVAYTNNNPAKKYACEIILIGKDVNNERNVVVHCHFEAYDKSLVPGTYMNAEISTLSREALVLPEDAVVSFQNKKFVFTQKGEGFFEMKEINTGITQNGFIEIVNADKANFKDGTIVTKGAYTLLMKMKNTEEE